jgi:predicted homoserine dehydrogenase-like protein
LPIGLSEGCVLLRDVAKDDVISSAEVESPRGRLAATLWEEQNERWPLRTASARAPSAEAPLEKETQLSPIGP